MTQVACSFCYPPIGESPGFVTVFASFAAKIRQTLNILSLLMGMSQKSSFRTEWRILKTHKLWKSRDCFVVPPRN